jgi:hypothetical protein
MLKLGPDLFEREVREVGSFPRMFDGDRADVSTAVEVELSVLVQVLRLDDAPCGCTSGE